MKHICTAHRRAIPFGQGSFGPTIKPKSRPRRKEKCRFAEGSVYCHGIKERETDGLYWSAHLEPKYISEIIMNGGSSGRPCFLRYKKGFRCSVDPPSARLAGDRG